MTELGLGKALWLVTGCSKSVHSGCVMGSAMCVTLGIGLQLKMGTRVRICFGIGPLARVIGRDLVRDRSGLGLGYSWVRCIFSRLG